VVSVAGIHRDPKTWGIRYDDAAKQGTRNQGKKRKLQVIETSLGILLYFLGRKTTGGRFTGHP